MCIKFQSCNMLKIIYSSYFLLTLISNVRSVLRKTENTFQLPSNALPLQYNLTIEPNFENIDQATFNGSIVIKIKIMNDTNNITIHSKNLTIKEDSVNVILSNKTTIDVTHTVVDDIRDFYIIYLNKNLTKNEVVNLYINEFNGDLKFDNVGFYLARYQDLDKEKILALTDFQPIGARKAFPCFDEPALKATFVINIVRQINFTSVSNEELVSTTSIGNNRYKDNYKETVPMSTYIVAFSVCNYEHTVKSGRFRIYGKMDTIRNHKVDYVVSVANNALSAMENFTNIDYCLEKLDLFAVPSDYFEPGGMENWGLITISDKYLECNNESTTEEIQKCTILLTHEIAHQWFGNLVTPSWWNYFWLSEGFSTYMEYYITSLVNPTWETMNYFIVNIQQPLLKSDHVSSQHLSYNTQNAAILPSPKIAYYKGAVILRMLKHITTPSVFQVGIQIYLKKNKFSSSSPSNLYEALQEAVDQSNNTKLQDLKIGDIMKNWESCSGYPLIEIIRNYSDASIKIFQRTYAETASKQNCTWIVPINYICSNQNNNDTDTSPKLWLTKESLTIYNIPLNCTWVLFNKQQTGYYRVNYDLQNWRMLIDFLKTPNFKDIYVLNRAQLIDDAFELANLNVLPYEIPLNLSLYLFQETHYVPITAFLNNIENSVIYFTYVKKQDIFRKYIELCLSGAYNYLGFDAKPLDTHLEKLTRIKVITWLCNLGHPDCQVKSLVRLKNWIQNDYKIFKDIEFPVLCNGLKISTAENWNFLYHKYKAEKDTNRQVKLFTSLGCTRNETLLNKFLDILLDSNTNLTISARKVALEKILYLDNIKAEMIFDYFIRHQFVANKMYVKIRFVEILCKNIVKEDPMEFIYLVKSSSSQRFLIQSCLNRIRRNIDLINQPVFKIMSEWLRNM